MQNVIHRSTVVLSKDMSVQDNVQAAAAIFLPGDQAAGPGMATLHVPAFLREQPEPVYSQKGIYRNSSSS
jgi:hypothetical protein